MSFRVKYLLAIFAAVCLSGALGGCTVVRNRYLLDSEARELPLVARGKKLPPSVHWAWVYEDWYMEHTQTITFEASLSDARAFAKDIVQDKVVVGGDAVVLVAAESDGWKYAKSSLVETGSGFPGGYWVQVAVVPVGEKARIWLHLSSH
eukprot:gene2295-3094_t